ncbi:MAG: hypothetical protein KDC59_11540 [Saprospiraceae bacterium]|nr:hypothetical protein [Saprospiraceae bacterium]HPG08543.1 hypothetical protein [Saprospiraceae bacterium]
MKKIFWFIALITLLVTTSCSNYTEELWINKDGSGSSEVTRDMGEMLPLLQLAMLSGGDEEKSDSSGNMGMKMAKSVAQSILDRGQIDTTIVVADLVKSVINKDKQDQFSITRIREELAQSSDISSDDKKMFGQILEEVLTTRIRFQLDTDKDLLRLTTKQSFSSVENRIAGSMGKIFELINKFMPDEAGKTQEYMDMAKTFKNSAPIYTFSDKSFSIHRSGLDLSSGGERVEQSEQMAKGFLGESKYRMIIHVPGKVKSVNVPGATISKNTVTWEIPLTDLIEANKNLDINIDYKGQRKYRTIAPTW